MSSFSGFGSNQEMSEEQASRYLPYLSLVFKMLAAMVILLLSGWVVYTIKTTRGLHRPHNIFIANLLVSGMVATVMYSFIVCTMMISYQLGVQSIVSCSVYYYTLLPSHVNVTSFLIVAGDKALALTFPYKHKRMMKPHVVGAIVTGSWLIAAIPTILCTTSSSDQIVSVPEYGVCVPVDNAFVRFALTLILPATLQSLLAVSLNIYLAILAVQVRRQIEKETRLSGESETMTALKKKQRRIRRNMKPIITLLVVSLGIILRFLFYMIFYMLGRIFLEYQDLLQYALITNCQYLVHLVNPIAYGLYFTEVREPMMKCLRRVMKIDRFNSVAPQP